MLFYTAFFTPFRRMFSFTGIEYQHLLMRDFTHLGIHLQKVMLKRNPAPFEQQRVSVPIEEQEQKCLSVCAIRCRECVKRVLLFPRLERQTQAANDVRPSAHIMWHEQRTGATCSTRVPGVFATFCGQKVEKERLQNKYTTKL